MNTDNPNTNLFDSEENTRDELRSIAREMQDK